MKPQIKLSDITREIENFNGDVDGVALLRLINGAQRRVRQVTKTKLPNSLVKAYIDPLNGNVVSFIRAFALLRWPEDCQMMNMFYYIRDQACKCIDCKP